MKSVSTSVKRALDTLEFRLNLVHGRECAAFSRAGEPVPRCELSEAAGECLLQVRHVLGSQHVGMRARAADVLRAR